MTLDDDRPAIEQVLPEPKAGRYVLHLHRNADVWTWAVAVAVAAELRRDLSAHSRARLVLTADDVAAPVYRALSKAPLEWSRIDLAQTDERWLRPDDPDSHAFRINERLRRGHAIGARFESLTSVGRSIEESVSVANAHGRQAASAAVLGMGTDGHLASLFPLMADLQRVFATPEAYAAVDATGSPAARDWLRRISITPSGLARARSRLLLLRGRDQREAFEYAIASGDRASWPVLAALDGPGPLQVHWCV
ncbi:6-phosphogluconolactonase [Cognatilysobacter bugurensis]|uniref:6-phosphogluconolactonase n=1 Tax=Cognatilysobacter bugurensis TaxID=543356 RepID=A0A918W6M8_9GAMM|nr:6-phosphogluconolactonase [Lysobacter bugurensis]GHA71470.1 6-phosphogluconolactonase [Lysobacter bugurensis]